MFTNFGSDLALSLSLSQLFDSLATAGYGTALGVIRSLHAEGVLEMAFCTETRPFNQVCYCHHQFSSGYSGWSA